MQLKIGFEQPRQGRQEDSVESLPELSSEELEALAVGDNLPVVVGFTGKYHTETMNLVPHGKDKLGEMLDFWRRQYRNLKVIEVKGYKRLEFSEVADSDLPKAA